MNISLLRTRAATQAKEMRKEAQLTALILWNNSTSTFNISNKLGMGGKEAKKKKKKKIENKINLQFIFLSNNPNRQSCAHQGATPAV